MKKLEKNLIRLLISTFLSLSPSFNAVGQSITVSGNQSVFVGEQRVYNLSATGASLGEITWTVGNGTVISTSTNNYQATIRFNAAGQSAIYVTARDFNAPYTSYITGSLSVNVDGPETPDNPTIKSNSCGVAVIRSDLHGGAPSGYRWYWQGKNATSTSTSLGYADEFTLNAGSGTYYLRARHTASGAWSEDPSSITVAIKEFTDGGSIEIQGTNNVICYNGDPPILTNEVGPSGTSSLGTSYVWQYANSSSGPWVNTNGTSMWTYNPPGGLTADRWYRRKTTSCGGQVKYSNVLMVDVRPELDSGGISGAQYICYSGDPNIIGNTATASNGEGGYLYQWQVSTNNSSWTNISGATATSYNPPGNMVSSRWYRRRVISCGQTKYTNKVKITVLSALTAGSTSGNQSICYGGNPNQISSIANSANGTTYSYQWQVSANNSSWANITGATATSYTPPSGATTDRWYRRRVISCGQTKYTTAVLIDVGPALTAGSISGAQTICSGENADNLVSASLPSGGNNSYAYQWQISSNNSSWSDVSGATGTSYNPTANLTADRWYRRKVSSCGQVAYTSSARITVIGALAAPTGSSTVEGCEYGNLNVSLVPASGGNTVRWYSTPTGGAHIDQGTLVLSEIAIGVSYYASTYNSSAGCESTSRKQVTIVAAPEANCGAPDSDNQNTFISGDTNMFVGDERTYTINPPVGLEDIVWTSNKGTILSYSANRYQVTIKFDAPGEFSIGVSGKETDAITNYLTSSLHVFVVGPPAPPAPLIAQNACGELILKHNGAPETGFRWYWQGKSSTNKSTSQGYATEFSANLGTGTYYLRNYHVASQSWSAAPSFRNVTTINQFEGGSIAYYSNSSNQICYGGDPPDLINSDLPPGRITTDTSYSWEYADNADGPWNTAGGTNGFYFDPPSGLTADRWYRRKVTSCNGEVRYSNVLKVEVMDASQVPQGDRAYEVCPSGTIDISLSVASGNVVRWYIDQTTTVHLVEGTLTLSGASIGSSFYAGSYNAASDCESDRVQVTISLTSLDNCQNDGPNLGTDPVLDLTISGNNYVYTRTYQKDGYTDGNVPAFFSENEDLIQEITYFDCLGRPIQQVGIDQSPDKDDIITHIGYDGYGRMEKEWLPLVDQDQQVGYGHFRTNDMEQATNSFYLNKYPQDFPTQVNPYSQKEFGSSPLNRVLKQAAPGEDWKLGNGHEVGFTYETNTSVDHVTLFGVTTNASNNTYVPTLTKNGTYAEGELYKNMTYDENHDGSTSKLHSTEEFTDKQGRVVLKRTYAMVNGFENPHDTYYVYDDYGNLTFVLPPKMEAGTASLTELNAIMAQLGYQYVYDQRNRLVEKQLPGKGKEYIIYNKADQPIMTQDANQRAIGEWLFTKYDALGRVAYTGKALDNQDRTDIQDEVDALTGPTSVAREDSFSMDGITLGYTNTSYPSATVTEVLTVNYYDGYSFGPTTGANITAFGLGSTRQVQGLATGSRVKVLDVSPAQWITTATYYDDKARPIYTHTENSYLGTVDVTESKLDFVGRPQQVRTAHTRNGKTVVTLDNFTYDHVGRLLRQTQCIGDESLGYACPGNNLGVTANLVITGQTVTTDQLASNSITITNSTISPPATLSIVPNAGNEELMVYNDYDELGQLRAKKMGGNPGTDYASTVGLQTVNYTYNVRGWLKTINEDVHNDNDLFNFSIRYNDPTDFGGNENPTALYNGNISQTLWSTANINNNGNPVSERYSYSYDALNRIMGAVDNTSNYNLGVYDGSGNLTNPITYDKNGNITDLYRSGVGGTMDNLSYAYHDSEMSNRLRQVFDASGNTEGFNDGNISGDDYAYDVNGNMISDANKEISDIEYNHLNLPTKITITGTNTGTMDYIYDATGTKLRKELSTGTVTEYAGNYIYEGNNTSTSIQFFNHPEGYATPNGTGDYDYVYQYKDQINNVRLSYSDLDVNGAIDQSIETLHERNYYPFGLLHRGYNNVVNGTVNNIHQYQDQEFTEDLDLNIHGWKYRFSDPAIGRFWSIDPLADDYRFQSPYSFSENRVVDGFELEGLEYVTMHHIMNGGKHITTLPATEYYKMTDAEINAKNGTPAGPYNAAAYGPEGKGVKHVYHNRDASYNGPYADGKTRWDNRRVDFGSRAGNHGIYSGAGSITNYGAGDYNFDFQPVDWSDAIAKRHDEDYANATKNGGAYTGYIDDTRTYQADIDMLNRLDTFTSGGNVTGVDTPFRTSTSGEMSLSIKGQKTVIGALAAYKKWKIDNGYGKDDSFGTLGQEFYEADQLNAVIIALLYNNKEN